MPNWIDYDKEPSDNAFRDNSNTEERLRNRALENKQIAKKLIEDKKRMKNYYELPTWQRDQLEREAE